MHSDDERSATFLHPGAAEPMARNWLPNIAERLRDNGSYYVGGDTQRFTSSPGMPPRTTLLQSSPEWLAQYNKIHPHGALGNCSLREFMRATLWVG